MTDTRQEDADRTRPRDVPGRPGTLKQPGGQATGDTQVTKTVRNGDFEPFPPTSGRAQVREANAKGMSRGTEEE